MSGECAASSGGILLGVMAPAPLCSKCVTLVGDRMSTIHMLRRRRKSS